MGHEITNLFIELRAEVAPFVLSRHIQRSQDEQLYSLDSHDGATINAKNWQPCEFAGCIADTKLD